MFKAQITREDQIADHFDEHLFSLGEFTDNVLQRRT